MLVNKTIWFFLVFFLCACAGGGTHEAPEILSAEYGRGILAVTVNDPDSGGGTVYAEWYVRQFDGFEHWESMAFVYPQSENTEIYEFPAHQLRGYEWLIVLQAEDNGGNTGTAYFLYADTRDEPKNKGADTWQQRKK